MSCSVSPVGVDGGPTLMTGLDCVRAICCGRMGSEGDRGYCLRADDVWEWIWTYCRARGVGGVQEELFLRVPVSL